MHILVVIERLFLPSLIFIIQKLRFLAFKLFQGAGNPLILSFQLIFCNLFACKLIGRGK